MWQVILPNGERVRSWTPFFTSARVLIAAGVDPATPLTMRHHGSSTIALRCTVGEAAKWTVSEEPVGRFRPFKAFPRHNGTPGGGTARQTRTIPDPFHAGTLEVAKCISMTPPSTLVESGPKGIQDTPLPESAQDVSLDALLEPSQGAPKLSHAEHVVISKQKSNAEPGVDVPHGPVGRCFGDGDGGPVPLEPPGTTVYRPGLKEPRTA
jgi:hypothetical protein